MEGSSGNCSIMENDIFINSNQNIETVPPEGGQTGSMVDPSGSPISGGETREGIFFLPSCNELNNGNPEPMEMRPRASSPSSIIISDDYLAEKATQITQAITLKHSLAEWSKTLQAMRKKDPAYQQGLTEIQRA